MKNLLSATLLALALLALGGCASTGALTTSTETDGVYYSSKDHTTAVGSLAGVYSGNGTYGSNSGTIPAKALDDTAPAPVATTDDANPDYQGGTTTQATTGSDYYSNSYSSYTASGFGQPYTGPGVSSFNYSPSANYAVSPSYYGSPYGYASAFGYGYSPFSYGYGMGGFGYPYGGFYDPFYSSFYSPFGYGSGLSIGFGYGLGGFGGFGYPYGLGGYGLGGYGYPYGYGGGYDAYGYGGYSRPVIYANGTRTGSGANPILVGPRGGRGGAILNGAATGNPGSVGSGRNGGYTNGYITGGNAMPTTPTTAGNTYDPNVKAGRTASTYGGGQLIGQPTYSTPGTTSSRTTSAGSNTVVQPQNTGRRGFFSGFFGSGASAGSSVNSGQPTTGQRRDYNQPQYSNGGGYSQPARRQYNQPSYSQPNYNQPSPSYSQPSYSQPSRSSGGGGGGSFGGGSMGGGGGSRRGGR